MREYLSNMKEPFTLQIISENAVSGFLTCSVKTHLSIIKM